MSGCPRFSYRLAWGAVEYDWDGRVCQRVRLCDDSDAPRGDDAVSMWLDSYQTGGSVALPALADAPTPFQQRLRVALLAIPFAATTTYGALAHQLSSSPRAVGQALGANALPLLVPCHRVVAATGRGGFAFGARWKHHLLMMEQEVWGRRSVNTGG